MGLYGDADLVMSRDVPYTRTLEYLVNNTPVDWTLYTVTCNVLHRDGRTYDLSQYFTARSSDHTKLDLVIPRAIVQQVPSDAKWDLVAVLKSDTTQTFRTPVPPGRIIVLSGVTDVP